MQGPVPGWYVMHRCFLGAVGRRPVSHRRLSRLGVFQVRSLLIPNPYQFFCAKSLPKFWPQVMTQTKCLQYSLQILFVASSKWSQKIAQKQANIRTLYTKIMQFFLVNRFVVTKMNIGVILGVERGPDPPLFGRGTDSPL